VDAIKDLKSYLVHVHINDNSGLADEHLVPGNGVIDFEAIINALHGIGYDGYLALEPLVRDPIKAFKDSKRYISRFLK
jgi:sugar phosphate isomerase/epimerase